MFAHLKPSSWVCSKEQRDTEQADAQQRPGGTLLLAWFAEFICSSSCNVLSVSTNSHPEMNWCALFIQVHSSHYRDLNQYNRFVCADCVLNFLSLVLNIQRDQVIVSPGNKTVAGLSDVLIYILVLQK